MVITGFNRFVIIIITNNHFDNTLTEILQFRRALVHNSSPMAGQKNFGAFKAKIFTQLKDTVFLLK
jgi:hypothetical protein